MKITIIIFGGGGGVQPPKFIRSNATEEETVIDWKDMQQSLILVELV